MDGDMIRYPQQDVLTHKQQKDEPMITNKVVLIHPFYYVSRNPFNNTYPNVTLREYIALSSYSNNNDGHSVGISA